MPFPSKAIANEFLKVARQNSDALTAMKVQKLVFFAHGWTLALTDSPLITDAIEAWDWGPVIPVLYGAFKRFGNEPITEPASESTFGNLKFRSYVPDLSNSGEEDRRIVAKKIVERIWETYGGYSAARLSNATHETGTPWQQVYRPDTPHIRIPDLIIKKYFQDQINAK